MDIRQELFKNQDENYKVFHSKLLPTVDRKEIIGVRVPVLRKIAKQAAQENIGLDTYYYEEKMIYGMKIGYIKCDIQERLKMLADFVPIIDNWAVCDCCVSTFKFVKKHQAAVWDFILPYLEKSEYEKRFAIIMMMDYYLDDEYVDKVLSLIAPIDCTEYYVNMGAAWALSVVFVKYPEKLEALLDDCALSVDIHNKTIQKIRESNRVSKEDKERLKSKKR